MKPYSQENLVGKNFTILGANCKIVELLETEWNKSCKTFFYRVAYKVNRGRKIYKMWALHRDFVIEK